MKNSLRRLSFLVVLLSGFVSATWAVELSLPAIFGDHMVLQRDASVPIWGMADPGQKVSVAFAGQRRTAVVDSEGKWQLKLKGLALDARGSQFTVSTPSTTITFEDVVVGDVWLCSGQSNMERPLRSAHNAEVALPAAEHPEMRLFIVPKSVAWSSRTEIAEGNPKVEGKWVVCAPDSPTVANFAAVGYFFGRDLLAAGYQPLGLIKCAYGASGAHGWTSLEALAADPILAHYAKEFAEIKASLPELRRQYDEVELPTWKANASGRQPVFIGDSQKNPAVLFQGMIQPILPYALKGAIWYQGENNGRSVELAHEYATLFPVMIADWRRHWGQGDFPFLFVQLSAYKFDSWAELRQSQVETLSVPNTGMAVSFDVGERETIHPLNKETVGTRLALAARHLAYGEDIVYSGPVLRNFERLGGKIFLSFDHVGDGLKIGAAPAIRLDEPAPVPAETLADFEIAGKDGKFQPAQAKIEGERVVVWNAAVASPYTVRYGWRAYPVGNLYNSANLPASPFSTEFVPMQP